MRHAISYNTHTHISTQQIAIAKTPYPVPAVSVGFQFAKPWREVPPSAAVSDDQLREVRQLLVMAPPGHPAHKCTETAELNSLAELRDLLFHPQARPMPNS